MKCLYFILAILICTISCSTHTPKVYNNASMVIQEEVSIHKAKVLSRRRSMQIGSNVYNIYLESDPIAPTRGERILDLGGILDYYMWIHKGSDGNFTMSIIDKNLNVYYYDIISKEYINKPNNTKIDEKNGKIEPLSWRDSCL